MISRFVYPFAFLLRQHDLSRRVRAFQIRDGAATLEIVTALAQLNWQYGGLLLNYPPLPNEENGELLNVSMSAGRGDRILTTTRPPVGERGKKRVTRGWTDLEADILAAWRPYFQELNRLEVQIAPWLRVDLLPGYEDRHHIFFLALEGARYSELGPVRYKGAPRSAAFLLHTEELGPGSPGYIGLFGMDGTTTLIWAHLLRTRHRELLEKPGFVMAELSLGTIPTRTTNLGFAEGWEAKVILHRHL